LNEVLDALSENIDDPQTWATWLNTAAAADELSLGLEISSPTVAGHSLTFFPCARKEDVR